MRSIESLRRAVETWRSAHGGRRGPLPLELRRQAGLLAGELGDEAVADALDLKRTRVGVWRAKYRGPRPHSAGTEFIELSSTVGRSPTGMVVEVSRGGRVVRIQGSLEAGTLASIICAVFGGGEV